MASWIVVPCLRVLVGEFNALNPKRDKSSDGSIGDRAHQDRPSDHNPDETGETPYEDADSVNEVHAVDVDETGPWPRGRGFADSVDLIRVRHQRGDDNRLQNIIYKGRIASRSWGWTWRTYTGANKHDKHAHFSARYTTAQESDTRPWGLLRREDDDMNAEELLNTDLGKKGGGDTVAVALQTAMQQSKRAADTAARLEKKIDALLAKLAGGAEV